MSDSMERNKNELLAAKELEEEEEEMKRELLDMGMYESGYTYKEMKDILGFISESKNMATMVKDNKNVQKETLHSSSNCTPQAILKANTIQASETQEDNSSNRCIQPYKRDERAPVLDRISNRDSTSSETMSIFDSRSSIHRRKSSDSDDVFERSHDNSNMRDNDSHSTNRYVSLRTRNSLQDSHNAHTGELKMDGQPEHSQKSDKWRINPLDCCISENDVPLKQPDRPAVQDREYFRSCKNVQSAEMLENVLTTLNLHLKQTADLWHSWHRTSNSKFQWGSPIQVGTANGSLDREPIATSTKNDQNKIERINKTVPERATKRKFLSLSTAKLMLSSDDEDDLAEFSTTKKKKIQLRDKPNSSVRDSEEEESRVSKVIPKNKSPTDHRIIEESQTIKDTYKSGKSVELSDEEKDEEEIEQTEISRKYPRRIIPPNPIKHKRGSKSRNDVSKRTHTMLSDGEEEISMTSKSDTQNDSSNNLEILPELTNDDNSKVSKKVEIKPIPLKSLSVRLERGCALLKKYQLQEQKKKEAEIESAKKKEKEDTRRMEETIRKRVEEIKQQERQKEELEKVENEKRTKWNNVLQLKSRESKERIKSLREQEDVILQEPKDYNRTCQRNNIPKQRQQDAVESTSANNVRCPICNKLFPDDRIEIHAAECEQYIADDNEDMRTVNISESRVCGVKGKTRDVNVFECNVCSKFTTTSGIDYEDHVNSCLQRKQQQSKNDSYGCTTVDIHNIPTSPIRCFQPISQQSDSEINYQRQFASGSKMPPQRGRKRKR